MRNFWLWLIYGKFEVMSTFSHYKPMINFGLAPLKAEGSEYEYDEAAVYDWTVVNHLTGVELKADSRREARAICRDCNALRGL